MKKLNNRGFSLVELIVTFTLVSIMMFLVLELTVTVRHSYNLTGLKTELLTKQSMILSVVNADLNEKKISEINDCGTNCFQIVFYDSTSKHLIIDKINNVIRYGSEAIELGDKAIIGNATAINSSFVVDPSSDSDSYVIITIPITNTDFPEEDFTISLMYQYHSVNDPLAFGIADPGDPGDPGSANLTAYNAALSAVNQNDYTTASWSAYDDIVQANVVTSSNTQAEVDTATANITAAQADLVLKANLTNYLDALSAVNQNDYTTASWSTYDDIVQANVVTEQNTQAEVDTATSNITAAQADLVLKADLTAYNAALAAVDEGDWTPASWSTYDDIVQANVVTEQNTQAQVNTATSNITAAQADLVPFIDLAATMSVSTVSISSTASGGVRTHTIQVTVTNGHGSVSIGSWVFTIGPGGMGNFSVSNPVGCNIQTSGTNYIISNGASNGTITAGNSITFNMTATASRNDTWAPALTNFGATE